MRKHLLKLVLITTILMLAQASCAGVTQPTAAPTRTTEPATLTPRLPTITSSPTARPATAPPEAPTSVPPNTSRASVAGSIQFQNPVRYQVEYAATVYNRGFGLDKLLVYQPLPVDWDGQGAVEVEEISPDPAKQSIESTHGNGIIFWNTGDKPQSSDSLQFKIRFSFTGYEIVTRVDPEKIGDYDQDDPLYKLYTQSERYIESNDKEIVEIADRVAGDETNPYKLARKFYDYVVDTASYKSLGKGLLGAKSLATSGYGECGDYAALFIALARAKGIPARPVVGYWAISGINQTHVWAEFYLEGVGWIPVDPTIGQDHRRDYYFGNMDNQRVILNKGFNIELFPAGPDNYIATFLQVPLWWYWGSSGDANAMTLERTNWMVRALPD